MTAMPLMIGVLCAMAIAYRYYSAFLAARVAMLDESRVTPAIRLNDGQNYHPTSKWVLFGHHFAAISGAGPLIGPVLAAQFGYLPGLLWIVIGVCLGGATQDFLVLVASIRRGGKSLAQIALSDVGRVAGTAATIAIIGIVVVALAGLGKVVVKALGGEEVKYPANSRLTLSEGSKLEEIYCEKVRSEHVDYVIPRGSILAWNGGQQRMTIAESFTLAMCKSAPGTPGVVPDANRSFVIPPGAVRLVPGSSWGTFTIACTIPIALFVGFWMYRFRKGRTIEASIIGGVLTLVATFAGGYIARHPIGQYFNLTAFQVTWAMAIYGFIAAVLPVWVLLAPRDYLSSFLKIGTIGLLVGGTLIANPRLEAPAYNAIFSAGGPTVKGNIFPFLFITIMCGAISGFHALVSSGTTPKMIINEKHARPIGYGAMLIEGLVGVVAMIAAATLPMGDYYAMNTDLANVPAFHDKFVQIGADVDHLNVYEARTEETLRGRTGGAVTLAVGMAHIFDGAAQRFWSTAGPGIEAMWKYWYHFAIMFEALFILTTIDAGTRIGRFLLQEVAGKIHAPLGRTDSWLSATITTLLIVIGWAWFMNSDSFLTIWTVFGIANQMLAVIALAIVSAWLVNEGRAKYLWVTIVPMLVVMTTTTSAAVFMMQGYIRGIRTQLDLAPAARNVTALTNTTIQASLLLALLLCGVIIIAEAAVRIWRGTSGGQSTPSRFSETATPSLVQGG